MKNKNLYLTLLCLVLGILMGKFMLDQYSLKEEEVKVAKTNNTVYFIEAGIYSSKEEMEEKITNVEHYIYREEDGKYYSYVGMTLKSGNIDKLKEYFKNIGYEINVREFTLDEIAFLEVLQQYDLMLEGTDDANTISAICSQVLSKYEEIVLSDEN